ncbi:hypothetical protein [Jidongwangia harbinensis]|uniref:hypothetical protein n=1 Tax=Jidongwangia harbinensis TaxID=2878561 RepID=UPI001CDA3453|nr:hypothetical protein [Jidongwangia harbinensis]MCA2217638.1 hypothetical protein [Jidongwangia harbinensis]
MSSTYTYKFLRASWGVRIVLTAEARGGAPDPDAVAVADGLYLLDATESRELTPEQLAMLGRGLGLVASEVLAGASERPVTVVVRVVEHNVIDYQDEGMAAAVLGWAIAEFGLAPREIPVIFDKSAGRYAFDFDAVHPSG